MLNSETIELIDKLYDVKGDNSSLLIAMQEEKEHNIELKAQLSKKRDDLRLNLESISSEEKILASEGEDLKIALAKVSNDNFSTILRKLDIEFDPYALGREVERKLPAAIEEVNDEKNRNIEELDKTEEQLNNVVLRLEELDIRHDEIISNQLRLRHYYDLAMKSDISATREEITSLLLTFNFSDEEARELAKLLMFPEDGLFEYEENLNNKKSNKSMADILSSAKEKNKAKEIVIEEKKEEKTPIIEDIKVEDSFEPVVEIVEAEENEVKQKSNKEVTKEDIIEFFAQKNVDYLNFTNNDIDNMINNFSSDVYTKNIDLINKLGINNDIFSDNINLLADKDLEEKINVLKEYGKTPKDIYLNSNILIKYNLKELKDAINVLKENGLNPKDIPLMAY